MELDGEGEGREAYSEDRNLNSNTKEDFNDAVLTHNTLLELIMQIRIAYTGFETLRKQSCTVFRVALRKSLQLINRI